MWPEPRLATYRLVRGVVLALSEPGAPDPLAALAGVPLATRAALSLKRAGLAPIALVASEAVAAGVRARLPDVEAHAHLAAAVRERSLVLRHDQLVAPRILDAMAQATTAGVAAVAGRRLGLGVVDPARVQAWEEALPSIGVEGWHADARDADRALHLLLDDCRKPVDGLVARHLNRRLSLALTRRLVGHPAVTPNAMTGVMLAISLSGALAAARGGYAHTLAGAALMQLGSILDGVDGELARLRFEETPLGAWLDTVADDLTNVAFWAGLARGAPKARLARAGAVAAVANALAAVLNYGVLARRGDGDLTALPDPPRRGLARAVALLLKQDTFLALTLVLALAGRLHGFLPAIAAGALVTLGASAGRAMRPTERPVSRTGRPGSPRPSSTGRASSRSPC